MIPGVTIFLANFSIDFFDSDFSPLERAMLMGKIFPEGIVYRDHVILKATLGGLNFDVKVLVNEDPSSGITPKVIQNKNKGLLHLFIS